MMFHVLHDRCYKDFDCAKGAAYTSEVILKVVKFRVHLIFYVYCTLQYYIISWI